MLVVTGAVAYDYIFPFNGRFTDHILPEKLHVINISCVVNQVERRFGGTAGNQAYTLGLLGMKPILLAASGRDFENYDLYLRDAGVDTSFVSCFDDLLTPMGFALYDYDDNQIWGFAKNSMVRAAKMRLSTINRSVSFVLITPDEFSAVKNYLSECQQKKIPYAFDPAFDIPKLSKDVLRKGVELATVVFGNDYEMAQLKKRVSIDHQELTTGRVVVTTLGDKGSVVEIDKEKYRIKPAKPKKVVSPSGAGDAYRAGFMAGFLRGFKLPVCGQMGSLAAIYPLEHSGTIEHRFTKEEFVKRYRHNFGEELVL